MRTSTHSSLTIYSFAGTSVNEDLGYLTIYVRRPPTSGFILEIVTISTKLLVETRYRFTLTIVK